MSLYSSNLKWKIHDFMCLTPYSQPLSSTFSSQNQDSSLHATRFQFSTLQSLCSLTQARGTAQWQAFERALHSPFTDCTTGNVIQVGGRSDVAIRRCWQEWVDSGIFQRHEGSGRPRTTVDLEDRLIVRSAVTAPDLSLSTIRRATRTRVSTMIIHRQLIERNLRYATCHSRLHTIELDYNGACSIRLESC
ncbi:HTH_Tnp_Tc3_2 domain-containing protein [Trichonephila clavipes]|nr:HTH_Tnp_Tc3_2 domain-containing protein [Trichonephila clavipes]